MTESTSETYQQPSLYEHIEPLHLVERVAVRTGIVKRMYDLDRADMLGVDLELSAMVRWLAEGGSDTANIGPAHISHVYRMIAFRLGYETLREDRDVVDIEAVLGKEAVDEIMVGVEKASVLDTFNFDLDSTEEEREAWDPIMDDVFFVIDSVSNPSLVGLG